MDNCDADKINLLPKFSIVHELNISQGIQFHEIQHAQQIIKINFAMLRVVESPLSNYYIALVKITLKTLKKL